MNVKTRVTRTHIIWILSGGLALCILLIGALIGYVQNQARDEKSGHRPPSVSTPTARAGPELGSSKRQEEVGAQQADLTAQIDRAEEKWREREVDSYRIVVQDSSLWHFQTHDIVVRDGVVEESSASCIPAPIEGRECKVREFDAAEYIVPGLFGRARWIVERGKAQFIRLEFDRKHGFPSRISYDDPEVTDEEWGWGVQEFEVLE